MVHGGLFVSGHYRGRLRNRGAAVNNGFPLIKRLRIIGRSRLISVIATKIRGPPDPARIMKSASLDNWSNFALTRRIVDARALSDRLWSANFSPIEGRTRDWSFHFLVCHWIYRFVYRFVFSETWFPCGWKEETKLEAFKTGGEKERERKKSIAIINEAWADFSLCWRERQVRFASTITKLPRDNVGWFVDGWHNSSLGRGDNKIY